MKEQLEQINNQNKQQMQKLNTLNSANKITSFKDLKKELLLLFSVSGHSNLMDSSSLLRKVFSLVCMVSLVAACLFYVQQNLADFREYNVVTQIKFKENSVMTFPALTLCLQDIEFTNDLASTKVRPLNFSDSLKDCYFENPSRKCSAADFEYFRINNLRRGTIYSCAKFNSGKNSSGHTVPLFESTKFGKYSGLTITSNLTKLGYFIYGLGENFARLSFVELARFMQPRKNVYIGIRKTVDAKLPKPYDNCKEDINPGTSRLVRAILEQNVTYRKVTCYDFCLEEYALKNNLSTTSVFNGNDFNYTQECSELCPLECKSSHFETVTNEYEILDGSSYRYVRVNFHFMDEKYTDVTQAVKTTEADFVSNAGGVLGLFLELSFFSVYKLLIFVADVLSA